MKPAAVYSEQGGSVTSLTMIDNSTSVASASSNGTVHVWKVPWGGSSFSVPFSPSLSLAFILRLVCFLRDRCCQC